MSEESTTFTTGSLQTFVAGAFIVALLALGMSIYNFSRTTAAVSALLDLQAAAVSGGAGAVDEHHAVVEEQLATIEGRLKALEESAAAATAAATPAVP